MKHMLSASIFAVITLFVSPFSASTLALPAETASNARSETVPGSIIRFEHLTIEHGLSQNAGVVIFQDSKGYLWIGTQDGLNRYDGFNFKIYKHDPDDPTSISHNSILSIEEDMDGYLWIGTWGGLNRFDRAAETFIRYRHDKNELSSLSNDTVTDIKQDANGVLWVGTLGGLDRYDPLTNGFDHFKNDTNDIRSLSSNAISVIFEDSNNQLWIGTGAAGVEGSGLNRFEPSTGKAVRYQHALAVHEAAFAKHRPIYHAKPADAKQQAARLREGVRLVALANDEIVGTAQYADHGDHIHILDLAVHPTHQGRRIARQLVESVADTAVRLGHDRLVTDTIEETGNVPLYGHLGFNVIERSVTSQFQSDLHPTLHIVKLERRLSPRSCQTGQSVNEGPL